MLRAVSLIALLCALIAPAASQAATVRVTSTEIPQPHDSTSTVYSVTVEAAPGEANRLILAGARTAVEVTDRGAPLAAGEGCTGAGPGSVRCTAPDIGFLDAEVVAGDGDDQVTSTLDSSMFLTLSGQAGDDTLTCTTFTNATLDGGDGADVLRGCGPSRLAGGAGSDRLIGGESSDSLDGGAGDDEIDGGSGDDTVEYARTTPVTVDLSAGRGGSAGEIDSIVGVEGADGGAGADTLRGDPGPNRLAGGGGADGLHGGGGNDELSGDRSNDRLVGGAGNDRLDGGTGPDSFSGGAGHDELFVDGALIDIRQENILRCGTGRDVAYDPSRYSRVPRGCETVAVDVTLNLRLRRRDGRIRVAAQREPDGDCRAAIAFDYGSKRVGSVKFGRLTERRFRSKAVRLTAYGRRLVRRRSSIDLRVTVRGAQSCRGERLRRRGLFPAQI